MRALETDFAQDGYCLVKGVFTAAETAELEDEFDRIVEQVLASGESSDATWDGGQAGGLLRTGDRIVHTHNVQKYSRRWLDAFLKPAFLDAAEAVLGPDIVLHHSKLFQKPAESGSPFPIHQDWPYFPTELDTMTAAVIHVSEATDSMGCLRIYPGSHHLGRIDGADGRRSCAALADYPVADAQAVEAEPGDVVFFHYLTLHGSMPNRSDSVRKTVLCQMHAGGDRVEDGNKHPDEKLVLRGRNTRISRGGAGQAA